MNEGMLFLLSENALHHPVPTFTQLNLPNPSIFRERSSEKFFLTLQARLGGDSPLWCHGNESSFKIKSDHNTLLLKILQRLPISLRVNLKTLIIAYSALQHLPPFLYNFSNFIF